MCGMSDHEGNLYVLIVDLKRFICSVDVFGLKVNLCQVLRCAGVRLLSMVNGC